MKKLLYFLSILLILALLPTACSKNNQTEKPNVITNQEQSKNTFTDAEKSELTDHNNNKSNVKSTESSHNIEPSESRIIMGKLIETTNKSYLIAEGNTNTLYFGDFSQAKIYLDGEISDLNQLKNGMSLEITFSGIVLESYPAILADITEVKATAPQAGESANLVSLYAQVLADIFKEDDALNHDIQYIGLDLVDAPGNLSDSDISAIAYLLENKLSTSLDQLPQFIFGNYDELVKRGFIDDENLYWEDGILLSIDKPNDNEESNFSDKSLQFDVTKWRSGLGAIFWTNCIITWDNSDYWQDYEIGSFAIS